MRSKAILLALLLVTVFSLLALGHLRPDKMTPGELNAHLNSLPVDAPLEEEAKALARRLSKGDEFVAELLCWHAEAKDTDFLLVYNSGGLGGSAMIDDPEWPSVMEGIIKTLNDLNYRSKIVEHQRASYDAVDFLETVRDITLTYSTTAPELAAKVAFLTKYNPDIRILITGRSNGAVFISEVIGILGDNRRVYSIQAGYPAGYDPDLETGQRTLLINENQWGTDALSKRDFWSIIRANIGRIPSISPSEKGSLQILRWHLKVPGHAYTWNDSVVSSDITDFLVSNFGD